MLHVDASINATGCNLKSTQWVRFKLSENEYTCTHTYKTTYGSNLLHNSALYRPTHKYKKDLMTHIQEMACVTLRPDYSTNFFGSFGAVIIIEGLFSPVICTPEYLQLGRSLRNSCSGVITT